MGVAGVAVRLCWMACQKLKIKNEPRVICSSLASLGYCKTLYAVSGRLLLDCLLHFTNTAAVCVQASTIYEYLLSHVSNKSHIFTLFSVQVLTENTMVSVSTIYHDQDFTAGYHHLMAYEKGVNMLGVANTAFVCVMLAVIPVAQTSHNKLLMGNFAQLSDLFMAQVGVRPHSQPCMLWEIHMHRLEICQLWNSHSKGAEK